MSNFSKGDKIAISIASVVILLTAIEKLYAHRTYGTGVKGFAAAARGLATRRRS